MYSVDLVVRMVPCHYWHKVSISKYIKIPKISFITFGIFCQVNNLTLPLKHFWTLFSKEKKVEYQTKRDFNSSRKVTSKLGFRREKHIYCFSWCWVENEDGFLSGRMGCDVWWSSGGKGRGRNTKFSYFHFSQFVLPFHLPKAVNRLQTFICFYHGNGLYGLALLCFENCVVGVMITMMMTSWSCVMGFVFHFHILKRITLSSCGQGHMCTNLMYYSNFQMVG